LIFSKKSEKNSYKIQNLLKKFEIFTWGEYNSVETQNINKVILKVKYKLSYTRKKQKWFTTRFRNIINKNLRNEFRYIVGLVTLLILFLSFVIYCKHIFTTFLLVLDLIQNNCFSSLKAMKHSLTIQHP